MIFFYIVGLVVGVFGLVKVTDKLIHLIKIIGHRLGWPTFIVSSIFLAGATSFPELFVGITSAIEGVGEMSLGNVLGANLTNITLVLGLATVIAGGAATKEKVLQDDIKEVAVMAVAPYLLLFDGELSRLDGLIMIVVYAVYLMFLIEKEREVYHLPDSINHHRVSLKGLMIRLLGWLAVLGGLAQLVVFSAENIANMYHISAFIIGLLLLSLGTTLPELIVQIKSARNKESGIFFGNLLGSMAVNSSLVLGIVAVISPIKVETDIHFFLPGVLLLIVFILLPFFARSKLRLERREGLVLLGVYLLFLFLEIV